MARKKEGHENGDKDKDGDLWQKVAEGVTPLPEKAKNIALPAREEGEKTKAAPPPIPKPQAKVRAKTHTKEQASPAADLPALGHGTIAGLDKRTAVRMKKGTLKIEGRLDLHGLTQEEAHNQLIRFVTDAHGRAKRQVLVITGKGDAGAGTGVLRTRVPQWLNMAPLRPLVVAFDYARPKDGGEGALYVRLRKPRET